MSKFVHGDTAWYFIFPEDGCGGFDIDQIELGALLLTQKVIETNDFLDMAYKSKEEAFKAIRDRINKLEHEKPKEW